MPLVSMNTVHRWYRKDSWVYKNFAYLFSNQIWDTSVPNGFSLCPYFWLALFSMTLFRVFVGFVLLARILFKPFGKLLERTDDFFGNIVSVRGPGAPTVFGLLLFTMIGLLLFMLSFIGYKVFTEYSEANALPALLIPIGMIISFTVSAIYIDTHSEKDRCKVEYYHYLIMFIGTALGVCLMPTEFKEVIVGISGGMWEAVCFLSTKIWSGITYFGAWLWWTLAMGVVLGIVGLIVDRIYMASDLYSRAAADKKEREDYEQKIHRTVVKVAYSICEISYLCDDYNALSDEIKKSKVAMNIVYDFVDKNTTITDEFVLRVLDVLKNEREAANKKKSKSSQKRNELCHKFSALAEYTFKKITWVFMELWTFVCLLCSLIKAKKQGVCPYLKFTDTK
jgi:hypothetical protein